MHHVQRDLRARGWADAVGDAQGLEHWVAPRAGGPPCPAVPPPAATPILAEVGGLQENARATEQEHTGHTETFVDEWHRALRTRLGKGLRHESFRLVSTSQLCQYNMVCNLRRRC